MSDRSVRRPAAWPLRRRRSWFSAAIAGALMVASGFGMTAAAQQADGIALPGRVIGPEGQAIAGQVVLLHRVSEGSGATVATDTTDDNGRFVLTAGQLPGGEAAYFVAARYEGELYIGAPFRPPLPPDIDYTVQVGVPGTSATALLGSGRTTQEQPLLPTEPPFPYRAWLFLIIPLLVVALAAGYLMTRQRGPLRRRRTLLQIARLDETHDEALAAGHIADSTLYWAERRALLERLERES